MAFERILFATTMLFLTTQMSHALSRAGSALLGRSMQPFPLLVNQPLDHLTHAMIVLDVIVATKVLYKVCHGHPFGSGDQKQQGAFAATLTVEGLLTLPVARHVLEVAVQPRLQRLRGFVDGQGQGVTVQDLARVAVGPHPDPMSSRLPRGIRVDDVPPRRRGGRRRGQSVAGEGTAVLRGQGGMVRGQLIELRVCQGHSFHLSTRTPAHTVVDVVQHGFVSVNLQDIFKLRVDDGRQVFSRGGPKMQRDLQLCAQLGVQHGTVQMPVGGILKYEQRAMLALSPIFFAHHVALALSQAARGFQEAVISSEVFEGIVVVQFHRLAGVLFSSHQLLEFPKGKGVLGHVSIEPGRFGQTHHHQVGHAVLGGIVDLVVPVRGQDVVGAQFASHRGITYHVPVHLQKELSGDGGIQRHLTEQHFHFDVLGGQSQLVCPRVPHGKEIGRVQVHLDADLHLGHQQFAEMKHLDEGFEAQDVGGSPTY